MPASRDSASSKEGSCSIARIMVTYRLVIAYSLCNLSYKLWTLIVASQRLVPELADLDFFTDIGIVTRSARLAKLPPVNRSI